MSFLCFRMMYRLILLCSRNLIPQLLQSSQLYRYLHQPTQSILLCRRSYLLPPLSLLRMNLLCLRLDRHILLILLLQTYHLLSMSLLRKNLLCLHLARHILLILLLDIHPLLPMPLLRSSLLWLRLGQHILPILRSYHCQLY